MIKMKHILITIIPVLTYVYSRAPVKNVTTIYDPAELLMKIFNSNASILPRAGLINFENQIPQPDFINFEQNYQENGDNDLGHQKAVKFDDIHEPSYDRDVQSYLESVLKFENGNTNDFMKKGRKRKQRQQYGFQNPFILPAMGIGQIPPYPTIGGQYYRPPRPRPSLASEALTAVTEALTSIALYDDYQCVPRLLCEAAAGGALGTSGILQTVSGLEPLLTLLSAYNGISSNPLFVFGRAVFLGMSSSDNPATCRYAYSLCPNDPEQLVHYLNNHNGGFFRFFNAPQLGQQNVEQFYNQLSQNYGLYQPNQHHQQNYGINDQFHQNYGIHKPGLYSNQQQGYGLAYPYYDRNQKIRFKNNEEYNEYINKIEKRIQNKPSTYYVDGLDDQSNGWTFPEAGDNVQHNYINYDEFDYVRNFNSNENRKGKALKFPDHNVDTSQVNFDRKVRGFSFPEQGVNRQYLGDNYSTDHRYDKKYEENNNNYANTDNYTKKFNFYNNRNNDEDKGLRTVYVVRGNGDPNRPEIYKLRPGETVQ